MFALRSHDIITTFVLSIDNVAALLFDRTNYTAKTKPASKVGQPGKKQKKQMVMNSWEKEWLVKRVHKEQRAIPLN